MRMIEQGSSDQPPNSRRTENSRFLNFIPNPVFEQYDKQPVWRTIDRLSAASSYTRNNGINSSTGPISSAHGDFMINRVVSPDNPLLPAIQNLLEQTFSQDEIDDLDTLRQAASTPLDAPTRKLIYTATTYDNTLAGILIGADPQLTLLGSEKKDTRRVISRGYGVTPPQFRKRGIARELYKSALIDTADAATQDGTTLLFAASESETSAEKAWNSIFLRRSYGQQKINGIPSRALVEAPYQQPSLSFDNKTGNPLKNDVPLHLMTDGFASYPQQEDLTLIVNTIYGRNNLLTRSFFDTDAAYSRHLLYLKDRLDTLNQFYDNHGRVVFLDNLERDRMRRDGITIYDHTA